METDKWVLVELAGKYYAQIGNAMLPCVSREKAEKLIDWANTHEINEHTASVYLELVKEAYGSDW